VRLPAHVDEREAALDFVGARLRREAEDGAGGEHRQRRGDADPGGHAHLGGRALVEQARLLDGLNIIGTVLHGIDTDGFRFNEKPEDYLLFLGRFTEGKGVLQAIEIARRVGMRMILAAAADEYYREKVAPQVDGRNIIYFGEASFDEKVKLYGAAKALIYPIQSREPFGLVLAEAMACGTPVAALDRGAVREVVDDGVTGIVFEDLEQMVNELPRVFDLDRRLVRERAVARFGAGRMVDEYIAIYRRMVEAHRGR